MTVRKRSAYRSSRVLPTPEISANSSRVRGNFFHISAREAFGKHDVGGQVALGGDVRAQLPERGEEARIARSFRRPFRAAFVLSQEDFLSQNDRGLSGPRKPPYAKIACADRKDISSDAVVLLSECAEVLNIIHFIYR